ncbi:P-loop containing nucleoside triphosphate hydrolase protein [Aspergillus heteromorphus CBS 117.55]|uniref:P-loop containing nucleoside triphosphate hydrolase protein n=1 Tax=Aspergillus heteromorphus CBS 117.55 TaxID=1448321 RepID=A0A317WI39_9EURO|nr:P-loop containing nucleoside triphosphate hydrolase protein [Aspergillus heteromorphus CBS 117.55]PWY86053.1 P-loop containing nucleoside triphosphate hydrolase protein [Aspergillus heteromorphus CBS 117.55]
MNRKSGWLPLFSFTTTKHLVPLAGGVFFAILSSLATPIFAIILGQIFNSFTSFGGGKISEQDLTRQVNKHCARLAVVGAAAWVCNSIYYMLFVTFGELQVPNARTKLFRGLLRKNQEWFETQQDGTRVFLSSLQGQIDDLQKATSLALGLGLQYVFRATFSLTMALVTSWKLTLVTLAGIPILSAIISVLSAKTHLRLEAQKDELLHSSKIVSNATTSIDAVKCFNGQTTENRNFVASIDRAAVQYLGKAFFTSLQISALRLMTFGMFVQGFWYGSSLVTAGTLSAGNTLRTFWGCLLAAQSMEFLMPQVAVLSKGTVASLALVHILSDRADDEAQGAMGGSSYPDVCEGGIEVCDVVFAYPSQPSRFVLDSTSFFFPAGETTFVIGKSGSGKSTLGQLLTRFYLPASGEILIDGHNIQSLSIDWVRNNITVIEQRSVLFNESIFMNIAFGSRDHDHVRKADVQECVDLAMLQGMIEDLPRGIDTCVGHGGGFLSGGQRQRVAIARARLRDTPILIMDEPTSALDGTNRVEIMRSIREWRRGKTTIIITHDLSQILDNDFAYVLDQGSVVQAGYRYELEQNPKFFPTPDIPDPPYRHSQAFNHDVTDASDVVHRRSDIPSGFSSRRTSYLDSGFWSRDKPFGEDSVATFDNQTNRQSNRTSVISQWEWNRAHPHPVDSSGMQMYELNYLPVNGTKGHSRRSSMNFIPVNGAITEMKAVQSDQHTSQPSRQTTQLEPQERMTLLQIMLTILPNLTPRQRLLLVIGCLSTLGHSMATPIFSYCLSELLETFYDRKTSASRWALAVLGVSIGDGVVSFSMHYLLELCGQAWVDCLRKKSFQRILDQPRKWFEEAGNESSQLTACLNQSAEEMRNLIGRFGGYVLVATTVTVVAILWSLVVCWKLTLVAVACGPVIYAITRGFERTNGLWERRCIGVRTAASDVFVETFAEIRTVRTLTLEPYFHKKHMKAAAKCMTLGLKKALYTGSLFGLVESMILFVSTLIFYYGAVLVSSLEFTVQNLMTVFSILLFSIGYAGTVLSWIPQIGTSQEMANQLLRLANLPDGASHEHRGTLQITKAAPVEINRLNFRYPSRPEALVLRDVFLRIPKNKCTAIVGRSGSGKSTIASLLLGLYETPASSRGITPTISLRGIDIQRVHTPTLRSLITIVSQQPSIFPGTITANITYGLEDGSAVHSMSSVRAAAQAAGIDEFVTSLPDGYLTLIGDGGAGLSGGQAQRLVIARALVRQPQILILDEATSSLDPSNATIIRQTVQRLAAARRGLTVLIITHARDMMEIADNIIVLEQGRVVEEGSYRELARLPEGKLRALIDNPDPEEGETST